MGDVDKGTNPGHAESLPKDELNQLSQDEKEAFDKIMAEIEAGSTHDEPPLKQPVEGRADEEPDPVMNNPAAVENQIDQHEQTDASENPSQNAEGSHELESAYSEPDESEDDAALKQIMAEIAANNNKDQPGSAQDDSEPGPETADPDVTGSDQKNSDSDPGGPSAEAFDDELKHLIPSRNRDSGDPPPKASGIPEDRGPLSPESLPNTGTTQIEEPVGPSSTEPVHNEAYVHKNSSSRSPKIKKPAFILMAGCAALIAAAGAYRAFYPLFQPSPVALAPLVVQPLDNPQAIESPPAGKPAPARDNNQPEAPLNGTLKKPEQTTPESPLEPLFAEISKTRHHILSKIDEIQDLKIFYQKGIDEEVDKIFTIVGKPDNVSFDKAVKNEQVELSLLSIQRRRVYLDKLDAPLIRLESAAEKLLFWQRHAQLLSILSHSASGIDTESFVAQVRDVLSSFQNSERLLSIEDVETPPADLGRTWRFATERIKAKNHQLNGKSEPDSANRIIAGQVCRGNFENMGAISALDPQTAVCLLQWSGKDMYLNELIALPADVAKVLSQWPGEWLSLNGLRELSAQSARHLADWPGTRLSLNGLVALSPEATTSLSKWDGAQLEMIGLQSIGAWQNYGTRLYLSEKLRRQVEGR